MWEISNAHQYFFPNINWKTRVMYELPLLSVNPLLECLFDYEVYSIEPMKTESNYGMIWGKQWIFIETSYVTSTSLS